MPFTENTKAGKHSPIMFEVRRGHVFGEKRRHSGWEGKCGIFVCVCREGGRRGANNDLFLDLDTGCIAMFIAHFEL